MHTGASGRRVCAAVLWSNARYAYTVEGAGWRGWIRKERGGLCSKGAVTLPRMLHAWLHEVYIAIFWFCAILSRVRRR